MLAARDGGVGLVTFNQPEKRNAVSMEMWLGLGALLEAFGEGAPHSVVGRGGGVGLVTFNQPEKRNAISMEMWLGLGDILDAFEKDDTISVVVMAGAGD